MPTKKPKSDAVALRPLHISKVGSTWYAAIEKRRLDGSPIKQRHYVPSEDGSYVFAAIFLVKRHQGCFGYKDMDETMGPNEARAPLSLIRKLSPLVEPKGDEDICQYARQWRAKCEAYAAIPNYAEGDVIELDPPIHLANGGLLKTVRKSSYRSHGQNRNYYIDQDGSGNYRLTKAQLAGSKLKERAINDGSAILAEYAARRAQ